MQHSVESLPIENLQITSPSGPLELLACLPQQPVKQPLLFVHGAFGAASVFKSILPLIARAGYACYALSLRGHGKSWKPSAFVFHTMTGIDSFVADVEAAISYLGKEHPDTAPVLVGHSLGGGVLQHALTVWEPQKHPISVAGLVLLTSAGFWGGGLDVGRKWVAAEPMLEKTQAPTSTRTAPTGWLQWLRLFFTIDIKTGLQTPAHVRHKFFSAEASEEVVLDCFHDCKKIPESLRVSLDICWPIAEPSAVLAAIEYDSPPLGRKLLCISAKKDVLVTADVSRKNFEAYLSECKEEDEVLRAELGGAHHVMLDIEHERCADIIVLWLQGKKIP